MKGDVKVVVSGSSGHIVIDESNLIKRILLYLISAILGLKDVYEYSNKRHDKRGKREDSIGVHRQYKRFL